jgi:hypothetical protein
MSHPFRPGRQRVCFERLEVPCHPLGDTTHRPQTDPLSLYLLMGACWGHLAGGRYAGTCMMHVGAGRAPGAHAEVKKECHHIQAVVLSKALSCQWVATESTSETPSHTHSPSLSHTQSPPLHTHPHPPLSLTHTYKRGLCRREVLSPYTSFGTLKGSLLPIAKEREPHVAPSFAPLQPSQGFGSSSTLCSHLGLGRGVSLG